MIRNFLFHRVHPKRDPLWDPMDVGLFERCIRYISKKYEIRLFEDIAFDAEALKSKNKYATIMFDDGYKDNVTYALPILEKYKVKASFYVVTNCIDKNIPTWTHILDHSFQTTTKQQITLTFHYLPKSFQHQKFQNLNDKLQFAKNIKPFLKTLSFQHRKAILDKISETLDDVLLPKLMMSWDDLRYLKSLGHYVGSHTLSHEMLGTMKDTKRVKKELTQSGKKIAEELGHFPLTISYPIGSYNTTTKQLSQEAGYQIGLAVKQDVFNSPKEDLFEVARIELYNEPWWKTKLRILNLLENIKKIIGKK